MTDDEARKLARAFVEELRGLLGAPAPGMPAPPRAEAKYMRVSAYAKRSGFARSTVQQMVKAGMPSVPGRGGARIDVAKADEWLRLGGAARSLIS